MDCNESVALAQTGGENTRFILAAFGDAFRVAAEPSQPPVLLIAAAGSSQAMSCSV